MKLIVPRRPEVEVLFSCLSCAPPDVREERLRASLRPDLDWIRLLELSERHGVAPLLLNSLQEVCNAVPEKPLQALSHFVRLNAVVDHNIFESLTD